MVARPVAVVGQKATVKAAWKFQLLLFKNIEIIYPEMNDPPTPLQTPCSHENPTTPIQTPYPHENPPTIRRTTYPHENGQVQDVLSRTHHPLQSTDILCVEDFSRNQVTREGTPSVSISRTLSFHPSNLHQSAKSTSFQSRVQLFKCLPLGSTSKRAEVYSNIAVDDVKPGSHTFPSNCEPYPSYSSPHAEHVSVGLILAPRSSATPTT